MSENLSSNRLVRNEQVLRKQNVGAKNGIKKYFRNHRKVIDAPLKFTCECSSLKCEATVTISIRIFEKIHQRNDLFVITPGHVTPSVEHVVSVKNGYEIVEKIELKP